GWWDHRFQSLPYGALALAEITAELVQHVRGYRILCGFSQVGPGRRLVTSLKGPPPRGSRNGLGSPEQHVKGSVREQKEKRTGDGEDQVAPVQQVVAAFWARNPTEAQGVADEAADKCPGDTEQDRGNDSSRVFAWDEQPGNGSRDQTKYDPHHDV